MRSKSSESPHNTSADGQTNQVGGGGGGGDVENDGGGKFTLLVEKDEQSNEFGLTIKETETGYPVITSVKPGHYSELEFKTKFNFLHNTYNN